jgi:hypothetical protein
MHEWEMGHRQWMGDLWVPLKSTPDLPLEAKNQ